MFHKQRENREKTQRESTESKHGEKAQRESTERKHGEKAKKQQGKIARTYQRHSKEKQSKTGKIKKKKKTRKHRKNEGRKTRKRKKRKKEETRGSPRRLLFFQKKKVLKVVTKLKLKKIRFLSPREIEQEKEKSGKNEEKQGLEVVQGCLHWATKFSPGLLFSMHTQRRVSNKNMFGFLRPFPSSVPSNGCGQTRSIVRPKSSQRSWLSVQCLGFRLSFCFFEFFWFVCHGTRPDEHNT